jgi:phospholipid/cholesterol/gamma-HCH transport system substrate-binding protein
MKRSVIETILGALVLAVAAFFLTYSYKTANVGSVDGYEISADFAGTGGLKIGDDVVISGVKVGSVTSVTLAPDTFLARVKMNVASHVQLPTDTSALISSESIMGGRYLALEPGADDDIIAPGGKIEYTQAPQNLEQLLGKFIFSMQKDDNKDATETAAAEMPAQTVAPNLAVPPGGTPPAPAAEETPAAEPASPEEQANP